MQNFRNALITANLSIPLSPAVFQNVLTSLYPPSAGTWHPDAASIVVPLVQYLQANGHPLLFNAYPCFAYRDHQQEIRLDYALINAQRLLYKMEH